MAAMSQTSTELRVLVFQMDGHEYVVDVGQVREIVRLSRITHLDGAPSYVVGLLERRRRSLPVVDLRKRLELGESVATLHTCVIVAKMAAGLVGLLVDSATELLKVRSHDFRSPSPYAVPIERDYIRGVAFLDGRLLVMLDFERLLTLDEQRALGESAEGRA
jgi:purine-binding chemotaxis protein CheW